MTDDLKTQEDEARRAALSAEAGGMPVKFDDEVSEGLKPNGSASPFGGDDTDDDPLASHASDDDLYGDVNYDDPAYKQLHEDADKDDRLGDHDWYVDSVEKQHWPSGDPFFKIKGRLLTAANAVATLDMSPPPKPAEVARDKGSWDRNKKRAIDMSIALHGQLKRFYGLVPPQIKPGSVLRVTTGKQMDRNDRTKYFIRVVAFLDKSKVSKAGQETSRVPF